MTVGARGIDETSNAVQLNGLLWWNFTFAFTCFFFCQSTFFIILFFRAGYFSRGVLV